MPSSSTLLGTFVLTAAAPARSPVLVPVLRTGRTGALQKFQQPPAISSPDKGWLLRSLTGRQGQKSTLFKALGDSGEEGSFPWSSRASLTLEVDAFQRLGAGNGSPISPHGTVNR